MLHTTEQGLLIVYSGVLIASLAMVMSLGRLAIGEARATGWKDLRHNTYFIITAALVFQSFALIGISALRVYDGLTGFHIGGRWPEELTVFMSMLWLSKSCFHWAATLNRARWQWRVFVAVTILDIILITFWLAAI